MTETTAANIQAIPLDDIIPTPDNPRRLDTSSSSFRELVDSIKARGQLQNGIGRPHPQRQGMIDLRAGSRRYHALREAGAATMLVGVLDMTDAEAMEVTVLENLQRADLSPMEEASGVQSLIDTGHPLEVIAADIGKPVSWVARRARLTKLTPKWQQLAAEHSLPAAHLELIARMSTTAQDAIHNRVGRYDVGRFFVGPDSFGNLRDELADMTRTMKLAPWDTRDVTLHPKAGACASCQKRSSCTPLLFDPEDFSVDGKTVAPDDDHCLDANCWAAKGEALKQRNAAELAVKYPNAIKVGSQEDWHYHGGREKPKVAKGEYTLAKEGAKGAIPGLMIDGDIAGAIVWVKLKGEKAEKVEKAAKAKETGQPVTPLAERRAGHELRRKALAIDHLRGALDKATFPDYYTPSDVIALLAVFGTYSHADWRDPAQWTKLELLGREGRERIFARALEALSPVLSRRLLIHQTGHAAEAWDEAEKIAKLFDIDLAKLKRDADEELPEPKAWATEKKAGVQSVDKPAASATTKARKSRK